AARGNDSPPANSPLRKMQRQPQGSAGEAGAGAACSPTRLRRRARYTSRTNEYLSNAISSSAFSADNRLERLSTARVPISTLLAAGSPGTSTIGSAAQSANRPS